MESLSPIEKESGKAGTKRTVMNSTQTYCGRRGIFRYAPSLRHLGIEFGLLAFPDGLCADKLLPLYQGFTRSALAKRNAQVHVCVRSSSINSMLKEAKERGDSLMDFPLYR